VKRGLPSGVLDPLIRRERELRSQLSLHSPDASKFAYLLDSHGHPDAAYDGSGGAGDGQRAAYGDAGNAEEHCASGGSQFTLGVVSQCMAIPLVIPFVPL